MEKWQAQASGCDKPTTQKSAKRTLLTPSEASRLLLGSLGCILAPYSDLATKTERWAIWRREPAVVSHHLAASS